MPEPTNDLVLLRQIVEKFLESDPIFLPVSITDTTPQELFALVAQLRDRSNRLQQTLAYVRSLHWQKVNAKASSKRDRTLAYQSALSEDTWVKAGPSAAERQSRANQKADESTDLGDIESVLNELKFFLDVLVSIGRDLESARQDVTTQVHLYRTAIKLSESF